MPPAGLSPVEVLLESTVEFYRSNYDGPEPGGTKGENWLTESLTYAHLYGAHDEALKVVDRLLDAGPWNGRELGLLIGVRMSHEPALDRLTSELNQVQPRISAGIAHALLHDLDIDPGRGPALIESLILFNRQARISYLDTALAGILGKLPLGVRLPLAALLLDSPEEDAVRRAASKFYSYTRLAGKDGKVSASGSKGRTRPFDNEPTRSHAGHNKDVPASAIAEFWKQWWIDNQAAVLK